MIISQLGREKNRFLDIDKLIQCYLDKILLQHECSDISSPYQIHIFEGSIRFIGYELPSTFQSCS
jgi:hypothetical protein